MPVRTLLASVRSLINPPDDAVFEPRMPEVDQPSTLAEVFDHARSAAAAGTPNGDGSAQRCVVVVTPGRLLMLQPCPAPGSMPEERVEAIRKMISPERKRNIVAISYTELSALKANISKAIPFFGMLIGFAYIGHAVWVFEGHSSALVHGCQNADVLLVDGGMVPFLQPDWQTVAASVMQRQEIYVHDRKTFRLSRAVRVEAV
jgi:hypothetical protein